MESIQKSLESLDVLLIAYKECTDEKKKRMIHLNIVEGAMQYVKKIAAQASAQSGIPNEDLVQVGSIGLIKAIEFFDASKNTRFKTYATYFIKGEIKHYLRDKASIIKAPREIQELIFKISSAIKRLKEKGYEEPTLEQIAGETGVSVGKINEVLEIEQSKCMLSLDQSSFYEEDEISLVEKIPSGDYQEFINSHENKIMLADAIDKMPIDLKEVIELSFYKDMNQREISENLGISQMQVSRRLRKALNKMYEIVKEK